ncbi:MAG: hypothetical protein GY877_12815 [Hyphomicrobium sp.]|nr:hypothetical protein [Hyphomicrobium sp.]
MTALEEINDTLAPFGSRVWPLDYGSVSEDMRKLLAQPTLSEAESDTVMQNFLLPRQRLLKLIAEAGRKPQVPGGGEMSTFVVNHNYGYPQLFVVEPNVDYSRFDRFHVNTRAPRKTTHTPIYASLMPDRLIRAGHDGADWVFRFRQAA